MNLDALAADTQGTFIGLSVALGIGLLIGAERERRKDSSNRAAAGVRTFAVVALLGAVAYLVGDGLLTAVTLLVVGGGAWLGYQRTSEKEPGMTTEFALLLTCVLGALSMRNALLAAGVGAVLAVLLASRNRMHHFVNSVLSEQELHDIILFASAALIVLPVAPDVYMGPWDALNPRSLARLVVIVMAISAAGYVAMRWLGPRYGLPLAGFASGFISSTATIYAMGQRAAQAPAIMGAAVAGAVLSSFATIVQMAAIIALVQRDLLVAMAAPLLFGGLATAAYGLLFLLKGLQSEVQDGSASISRALDLKTSVGFALLLTAVLVISAGLNASLGNMGMVLGAVVSGFADAHATAASGASLAAAGKITVEQAILPILLGLTSNTITKAVVAYNAGGRRYAMQIIPGLVFMLAAVWAGTLVSL